MKEMDEQERHHIAQVTSTMEIEDMPLDSRTIENLEQIFVCELAEECVGDHYPQRRFVGVHRFNHYIHTVFRHTDICIVGKSLDKSRITEFIFKQRSKIC